MNINNCCFRMYVYTEYKAGSTPTTILEKLQNVWNDEAPSRSVVYKWIQEINRNSFQLTKRTSSGRPSSIDTRKVIQIIGEVLEDDKNASLRQIAELVNISKESCRQVMTTDMNLRKICSVWIPYELSNDHKTQRVQCCQNLIHLKMNLGDDEFMRRLIVVDETWMNIDARKPWRSELRVWCKGDEPRPRTAQSGKSGKRTMIIFSFSYDGKCYSEFTEGENIDSNRYIEFSENAMRHFGRARTGRLTQNEVLWMHDNARPHISKATSDFFQRKKVELVKQSPYSPDVNGCDRWLFKYVKKMSKGISFDSAENVCDFCRQTFKDISKTRLRQEYDKFFSHVENVIIL